MATSRTAIEPAPPNPTPTDPSGASILGAAALSLAFVAATRLPLARPAPFDLDEVGFVDTVRQFRFPMHHTLFLASARVVGEAVGDSYRGFVILDALVAAIALVAAWWWLRALVGPKAAAAGALILASAPVFWSYGAMAGNYTAIPLVGSILLGIAYRGLSAPKAWHPYVAASVLAIGAGYRQDLGTFWLPIFVVILWQHRWIPAIQAGLVFVALNLAWLTPMLHEAGGWTAYRAASAEFAYKAGYMNSVWNLGLIDAPARYAVKASMALLWTFGPGLLVVPVGLIRLRSVPRGGVLGLLMALSVIPALGSHLLIHFGVAGYAMHYAPALLGLIAIGLGAGKATDSRAAGRSVVLAGILALAFLFYPTDYDRPGVRGSFDLAFARHTRIGLKTRTPIRDPELWRTANSQVLTGATRPDRPRSSLSEVFSK